jgi:hypothetical protein
MNTIEDLNSPGNVNYNQQSSYSITYGANAGNTTANVDKYYYHTVLKQMPLTAVSNAVRDILIDWSFTGTPVANVTYTGSYANIGIQQIAPQTWRMIGIRDVARYNEAFANSIVWDNGTANSYTYNTLVQDQWGNNATWNTAVSVRAVPTLGITGNIVYNEDSQANITQVSVTGNVSAVASYTLTTTLPNNTAGTLSNVDTNTTNQVQITGNIATLNSKIAGGNIKFNPTSDFVSNVANGVNFVLSISSANVATANANLQIGNTHGEFSVGNITIWEQYDNPISFSITDLDTAVFTSNVIAASPDSNPPNTHALAINSVSSTDLWQGRSRKLTSSGSAATINGKTYTLNPNVNAYGQNITMYYQQTKVVDGTTYDQTPDTWTLNGTSLTANVFYAFSNNTSRFSNVRNSTLSSDTYAEDTILRLNPVSGNVLTTEHPNANDIAKIKYTTTITQTSPDPAVYGGWFNLSNLTYNTANTSTFGGQGWFNGAGSTGGLRRLGNITLANTTRDTINSNFNTAGGIGVYYLPPSNYTGNITFAVTHTQTDVVNSTNINLANAVPLTLTCAATHTELSTANIDTSQLMPVRLANVPAMVFNDVDQIDYKRYDLTLTTTVGNLQYGNLGAGDGPNVAAGRIDGNTITFTNQTNSALQSIITNTSNSSMRWTPMGNVSGNIQIVLTQTIPIVQVLANTTISANVTGTLDPADAVDGGMYIGACTTVDGFASNYHLIWNSTYTSNVTFVAYNQTTSAAVNSLFNGQTNTTALAGNIDAAFISDGFTGGTYAHNDWYMASEKESWFITAQVGGLVTATDYWTSTIPTANTAQYINWSGSYPPTNNTNCAKTHVHG